MKNTSKTCMTVLDQRGLKKLLVEILVEYCQSTAPVLKYQAFYDVSLSRPTSNLIPFDRVFYRLQEHVQFVSEKV